MKSFRSLAARLTLRYAVLTGVCFLTIFVCLYLLMQSHYSLWADEQLEAEMMELKGAYGIYGTAGVLQQLKHEASSEGEHFVGRLIDSEGTVRFESVPEPLNHVMVNGDLVAETRSSGDNVETVAIDGNSAVHVLYGSFPDGSVVQLGLTLFEHEVWLTHLIWDLIKVALLGLVLSVLIGGMMAGRTLAPIRHMARVASAISGRSMGQRVKGPGTGDDLDLLATSFNGMLERIDTVLEGLKDVTDSLAHDLRTPITGMRGMAEVALRSKRDPDEYRLVLIEIMEQLDRMLTLCNSIMDVSEMEAGAVNLRFETVIVAEVAEEVAQTFQPIALDKKIRLELQPIARGLTIRADRRRFMQVLVNLVDNAVKFTPEGGFISLSADLAGEADGVVVVVRDTGRGICEKDLPHIFERYYQGDKSRSSPGVGLGLAMVRGIVKAHGGDILVEAIPGKGCTFRVYFPSGPQPGR